MKYRRLLVAAPVALAAPFAFTGTAYADAHDGHDGHDDHGKMVRLESLNDSGATGTVKLMLDGNMLTVSIEGMGLVPGQPHAQHIHGMPGKNHTCPTMDDDKDGDGFVNVAEGLPDYGDITVSLTTKGDTTKASALAVDRMPVADSDGNVSYERTIEVSDAVAENLDDLHVVQHGIDPNGNGEYDFDGAGKSELNPKLPAEATNPANCGMIMPEGGVETGGGDTSGVEAAGLLGLGGAALAGAAGVALLARRRESGEQA